MCSNELHVHYSVKKLMFAFILACFVLIVSGIGVWYFWRHDDWVAIEKVRLPYGLNRLIRGHISMLWVSLSLCIFFLFAVIKMIVFLFTKKPMLIINARGIQLISGPRIDWEEIEDIRKTSFQGQEFVEVRLKDLSRFKRQFPWYKQWQFLLGDFHYALPNNLSLSNAELMSELKARLDTYKNYTSIQ